MTDTSERADDSITEPSDDPADRASDEARMRSISQRWPHLSDDRVRAMALGKPFTDRLAKEFNPWRTTSDESKEKTDG